MQHSIFGLGNESTAVIRLASADWTNWSPGDGFICGNRGMLV